MPSAEGPGGPSPAPEPSDPPVVRYSTLADPAPAAARGLPDHALRLGSRAADFLQLAHYHRMLQACGFAAEPALGAVIGTDGGSAAGSFDGLGRAPVAGLPGPVLAWADLDRPAVRTFSRSHPDGWRLRSLLERYDFELDFRVAIAEVAARQTGDPETDPPPLVRPIVNAECGRCHWWEHCRPQLDPDDVSLRIDKGALDSREIVTLRRHGIDTVTDLAGVDLDAPARLVPARGHPPQRRRGPDPHRGPPGPDAARRTLVRPGDDRTDRAADGRGGDRLRHRERRERPGVPVGLPGPAGAAALPFITSSAGSPTWTRPPSWTWPGRRSSGCAAWWRPASRCWSTTTAATRWPRSAPSRTAPRDPLLDWAAAYAEEQFVDLLEIVKAHYFGVAGLGLKLMAAARRLRLARRRPGRAQLPGLVRRGGARRVAPGPRGGPAARPGVQRGRRDRHLPAQSVAASPVIAASSVRRWVRSTTASTSSTPRGGPASAAASPSASVTRTWSTPTPAARAAKSTRVRSTEEPLVRRRLGRGAGFQSGEDAAAAVVGHHHPQVGVGSPGGRSSPVRSCRAVRSPTSAVVGRAVARARPAAVERLPSIPASPRLA